ncbi:MULTISPECIES: DUF6366 family protein [unclassified Cytobacillus]|uniref:DUF6366 family protein n=1 Tax=unclassified Cytobacillus TaxID=2675268 RepID=UPI00203AC5B6|nr:DUF6366 family protein [Cytobacillus sp. AMY 15.2]MCM3093599.1 DUF6366 family protein [Cytobacillus sp. AMY 15.2]
MTNRDETPEEKRERLKQSELKTTSALNDSLNRGSNGSLTGLTGGLGWKGTAVLIVVLIVGFVLYKLIF